MEAPSEWQALPIGIKSHVSSVHSLIITILGAAYHIVIASESFFTGVRGEKLEITVR